MHIAYYPNCDADSQIKESAILNMKSLFLLLMLLTGCAKQNGPIIDPAFQSEYDKFTQEAVLNNVQLESDRVNNLIMQFGTIDINTSYGEVIGECYYNGSNYTIVVDNGFWNGATDLSKEALLFHELGHCLLGRKHRLDIDPITNFPLSIMYPIILPDNVYNYNQTTYENYNSELFTNLYDSTSGSPIGLSK